MSVTLELDRYSGTFARLRVVGVELVEGMPAFAAPVVLATVPGPNGAVLADWTELRDMGGSVWFDDAGTIGKVVKADGTDETAVQFANYVKYPTPGDWLGVQYDPTTDPGHPRLVVLQHYVTGRPVPPFDVILGAPPVEPPPAGGDGPNMYPITGIDVAHALGLPAATPAMDDAALTACQLIGQYLDRDQVLALPELPQPIVEACLTLAIDVLQNRTAAGGQNVGIDGSVGPYRMGRSLLDRISGLIGPWMDQASELA